MRHSFAWWIGVAYASAGTTFALMGQHERAARLAAWAAFFMAWACYEKLTPAPDAARKEGV